MWKRGYELINTTYKEENKTYGTPLIQIVKRTNHMTEITYNDKEEMNHYMQCRLGDTCTRCNEFIGGFKKW